MNEKSTDLSVIIPCYNEEMRLPVTVEQVTAHLSAEWPSSELLLINDGSSDRTQDLIERAARTHDSIRGVQVRTNRGKGAAIARGVELARGRHLIFFDADLSYSLSNIGLFTASLDAGADLAIGARDLHPSESLRAYSPLRRVSSHGFSTLVERLLSLDIPDTQSGFKAFRADTARALFRHMTVDRFCFDVEVLFLARLWGLRIDRIPIEMEPRPGSSARIRRDAGRMVGDLLKIGWNAWRGRYPYSQS